MMKKTQKPNIIYCSSCLYPSSSAVPLQFNEKNICTGCLINSEKKIIDWEQRKKEFVELIKQNKTNESYDCLIPVSGGKDSFFQAHTIKELGYKALLVTYNGNNYSKTGLKNVEIMREVFGFDHIFYTPAISTLKKLNRLGMIIMGDMNWHNHCGIMTYPIKVAVEKKIPIIVWGEHGRADVGGMYSHDDFIEFSKRHRYEHDLRGYEWNDIIDLSKKHNEKLSSNEMDAWKYPSDEEINVIGVRGIYLSNYFYWDANEHFELVRKKYGFQIHEEGFERTYRKFSNLDDIHENGIHDYMKFVKFGYGRCTDHCSKDVRSGKLSREQAIQEIKKRDHIKSNDLNRWLKYVNWSEDYFDKVADTFRDKRTWWISKGEWKKKNLWGDESTYGPVKLDKSLWENYFIEN